jgi:CheY-like chemotaxis protein
MLAEDERIVAAALEVLFDRSGYEVVGSVGTGEAAVTLALEVVPDILVLDINLGVGIDGIEVATRIRQQAAIPIVFLTAYSDDTTRARLKSTQHRGCVKKPVFGPELIAAVESALKSSTE